VPRRMEAFIKASQPEKLQELHVFDIPSERN
jgi:hypothetical protein